MNVSTTMGLSLNEQITELLKKSNSILIVLPKHYSVDAIASSLALSSSPVLAGKTVDIVCEEFHIPKQLSFIPGIDKIRSTIIGLHRFVISINLKNNKINDFSYDVKDSILNIFLTPENGVIHSTDLSHKSEGYKYDLIITLDVDELESIGSIYETHSQFFFETPIIDIGHSPENEHFGHVNFVDITKTSIAELVYDFFFSSDSTPIDETTALYLLTGMISKTKSFKTTTVTPRSLEIAKTLITLGANRDIIIKNLYQTRSISTLKLWGKTLARLKHNKEKKLAWSLLQYKDFTDLDISPEELKDVIEELIITATDADVILLFYEYPLQHIQAFIYTSKEHNSLELAKKYTPFGNKTLATFHIKSPDLLTAGKEVIEEISSGL